LVTIRRKFGSKKHGEKPEEAVPEVVRRDLFALPDHNGKRCHRQDEEQPWIGDRIGDTFDKTHQ
jgi:hypothetical protein